MRQTERESEFHPEEQGLQHLLAVLNEAVHIGGNGNVGVGTLSPETRLTVASAQTTSAPGNQQHQLTMRLYTVSNQDLHVAARVENAHTCPGPVGTVVPVGRRAGAVRNDTAPGPQGGRGRSGKSARPS